MEQVVGKAHLAERLADKTSLNKHEADLVVDALFDSNRGLIVSALARGEEVKIPGFGTFAVRARGQRKGRNPATGQSIKIASTKIAFLKAGAGLKATVAGYSPPLGGGHGIGRGTRMLCPINPEGCPTRYRRTASQVLWCENGHLRAQMVPEGELPGRRSE